MVEGLRTSWGVFLTNPFPVQPPKMCTHIRSQIAGNNNVQQNSTYHQLCHSSKLQKCFYIVITCSKGLDIFLSYRQNSAIPSYKNIELYETETFQIWKHQYEKCKKILGLTIMPDFICHKLHKETLGLYQHLGSKFHTCFEHITEPNYTKTCLQRFRS